MASAALGVQHGPVRADNHRSTAGPHYQTLLAGIVADSNRRINELPLLTEAERRQIVVEWNDTRVEYPSHSCIHELFEAQVARTPEHVAIVSQKQKITYRELNEPRPTGWPHYATLARNRTRHSRWTVAGPLAGDGRRPVGHPQGWRSLPPLDPTSPPARLKFVLDDAGAPVVLTQTRLRDRAPPLQIRVISVDADWKEVARQSTANLPRLAGAEDLAYVMYTSGSTGTPKGVAIPHRAVVRLVCGAELRPAGFVPGFPASLPARLRCFDV